MLTILRVYSRSSISAGMTSSRYDCSGGVSVFSSFAIQHLEEIQERATEAFVALMQLF